MHVQKCTELLSWERCVGEHSKRKALDGQRTIERWTVGARAIVCIRSVL